MNASLACETTMNATCGSHAHYLAPFRTHVHQQNVEDWMDFDRFKLSHGAQLERVPQTYWQALFEKLCAEVSGEIYL